ncbi:SURF1 family cytochrome oxidase biogenesis protein [Tsukamurella tyrosinosolvens]|uniref:SURF1 family cytochrome oxidase biogenesis protein n=1 Tax=Tsukamurella tyrosinosolvens TaxID=57704 RepID=UPI002DD451B8|nr:SURF1 family cytochrome oxidase biogenesis protein [Tsukamurella tyrosinosolvens]MEC4613652.1 SURF1 family cytochrome oxidase biogenesis protein [Tsukamurella tyrosinosolvens]
MPSWIKVVFQPRWIALAIAAIAFTALCWSVLAPWQLGKNSSTSHRNQQIADSVNADPVPAAQVLGGRADVPKDAEWRRVVLTGQYLADKQSLARLRNQDGKPAYEVLVPFAANDGATYLVDRGFVRTPTGGVVPEFAPPPSGTVTVQARVRAPEKTDPARGPRTEGGYLQVFAIDPAAIGPAQGVTFAPGYLNLDEGQPGGLDPIPLPMLDAGPYLSYGLQWLAFGIMAPLAIGYFVWSEVRRRREDKAVFDAGTADSADAPEDEATSEVTPEAARAARLADRYGRKGQ